MTPDMTQLVHCDGHTEGLHEKCMGLCLQRRDVTSHNKELVQVQVELISAKKQETVVDYKKGKFECSFT